MARLLADITPLRVSPAFRRVWIGQALAHIGAQFTAMAVSLQVFDITKSTLSVGLLGGFSLIPLVVFGLYGGTWSDRFDRRKITLIASSVLWFSTLGIALQAWLHVGSVWLLYVLMMVHVAASSINYPARSAIIPRLLPPNLMPAANALNSGVGNLSVVIGPVLGAATVAAFGYEWAYTIDAIAFTAALYSLFRLPPIRPLPGSESSNALEGGLKSLVEGFRYLATRTNVRMSFLVDLVAMILANPWALIPAVAMNMIGGGETTAGWLTASVAIGATLAMVFSGPLGKVRLQGRIVLIMVVGWGASIAGFGVVLMLVGENHPDKVVPWALAAAMVCLMAAGAFDGVSSIFRNTILQVATPDDMRGRLQGVFTVVVSGGPNLGRVVAGGGVTALRPVLPSPIGVVSIIGGLACMAGVLLLHNTAPKFAEYDSENPVP